MAGQALVFSFGRLLPSRPHITRTRPIWAVKKHRNEVSLSIFALIYINISMCSHEGHVSFVPDFMGFGSELVKNIKYFVKTNRRFAACHGSTFWYYWTDSLQTTTQRRMRHFKNWRNVKLCGGIRAFQRTNQRVDRKSASWVQVCQGGH